MTRTSSNASLILYPEEPDWSPDKLETITNCLNCIGLISDRITNVEQHYLAGDKFLDLITFMGCSPSIKFSPDNASNTFTFINLITTSDITALTSGQTQQPHCPACNKSESDWRNNITATALQCSTCGKSSPPWHYNWRKSAGFGKVFVEITEIYPKEAIPQQALLDSLRHKTGLRWQYFYYYG